MVFAFSNLILLIPVACTMAIMLSMTSSTVLRARNDGMRVFLQILIWQLLLIGLIGLLARGSLWSLVWLFFVLVFLIHLWFWDRSLARNILLMVFGTNAKSPVQLNKIVHYLDREGRGYWRRLGRRFGRSWQNTGDWQLAMLRSRLARPARIRLALASLATRADTARFNQQLARTVAEQTLVSQWLGRLLGASLSILILLLVGSLYEWAIGPTFQRMLDEFTLDDLDLLEAHRIWSTTIRWKVHIWFPLLVWSVLAVLYLANKFPILTRHRPLTWLFKSYYRGLAIQGLADGFHNMADPVKVSQQVASSFPVPIWSRKLVRLERKVREGATLATALSKSGILRHHEATAIALCQDHQALSWALQQLSQGLIERTMNRCHMATQLCTVVLTLLSGVITCVYAVATFGTLIKLIEHQL